MPIMEIVEDVHQEILIVPLSCHQMATTQIQPLDIVEKVTVQTLDLFQCGLKFLGSAFT
jgi:hypothetical protein